MARREIEAAGRRYLVAPDDEMPPARRAQAVAFARLVDEMTDRPPGDRIALEPGAAGLSARVASDGLVGWFGVPGRLFPSLDTQSYALRLSMEARGYVPRAMDATVPQNLDFPNSFFPVDLGRVSLHREPTVIAGRTVVRVGNHTSPVGGAAVDVTGVWPSFPPADAVVPADPPDLVALSPPVTFDRTAGAGVVRRREAAPVAGEDKSLLDRLEAGDPSLRVSDRVNLASGDLILIGEQDDDLAEYLAVDVVSGASTPDQPARIRTASPAMQSHRAGTIVRRVTLAAPGPDNLLIRDAIPGDTCLFLDGSLGLAAAQVVEVSGGPSPAEYHRVFRFSVVSDPEGYFRLPPIARVAQLEIRADDGAVQTDPRTVSPDYSKDTNHYDLVFA